MCILYFQFCVLKEEDQKVLIACVAGQDIWNNNTPVFAFPCHPFHMFLLKQDRSQAWKMCESTKKAFKRWNWCQTQGQAGEGEEEVLIGGKWKGGVVIKWPWNQRHSYQSVRVSFIHSSHKEPSVSHHGFGVPEKSSSFHQKSSIGCLHCLGLF